MSGLFARLLARTGADREFAPLDQLDLERVTALMLVEIARSDHVIEPSERHAIADVLQKSTTLSAEEIEALIVEGLEQADSAVSLHKHITMINQHFSKEDKIALVEQMWQIAQADGDIDRYEEYTIRKLCDLVFVKHRDFMQAKHRVLGD